MKLASVNLLRTISIFLMFFTHSIRLVPKNIWEKNSFFFFLMKIEPLTSAIFLFLVGFSLVLSRNNFLKINEVESNWKKQQIFRSFFLYIIGVSLFLIQFGVQLPDVFLSPNILSSIAISIITNVLLINKQKTSIFFIIFIISLELILDFFQIGISGLNKGPGGSLILIAFSLLGQVCANAKKIGKDTWILCFLMILASSYPPWTVSYKSQYLSTDFIVNFTKKDVSFWTHTFFAFLGIAPIFILASYFILKDNIKSKYLIVFSIPGQFSLDLYIFHLCIIAYLSVVNVAKTNFQVYIVVFFLILFSYGYSSLKSFFKNKKA